MLFKHLISFITLCGLASAAHVFTINNKCGYTVDPIIANTNCGYSPRCNTPGSGGVPKPAIPYKGPQPGQIPPHSSKVISINDQWNGRIFNQNGKCGAKGERCTVLEYNLGKGLPIKNVDHQNFFPLHCTFDSIAPFFGACFDTGSQWTPQAYDISNIQGFTQSVSIGAAGCQSTTCTSVHCPCSQAYPPGDTTGCGNDSPVRACGAGNIAFSVTFCP